MSQPKKQGTRLGRPPTLANPVETICKAAARLFSERGYDGTSLSDIASEVKITKAAIYHYFPTKAEIFDTIVLQLLTEMRNEALEAVAAERSAQARLQALMRGHAGFIARNLTEFRTMFNSRGGSQHPYTPAQIEARLAYEQILRGILADGAASGELKVEDVATTCRALLGMLNWLSRWYATEGPKSPTEIADLMCSLSLNGLLPRG